MASQTFEKQLLDRLKVLDSRQQIQVLDYVNQLTAGKRVGVPGKELLRFAGAIAPEDLKIMASVIQEECERVDLNEW